MRLFIEDRMKEANIEYKIIEFQDSEFNDDLEAILTEGQEFLAKQEEKLIDKQGILVKCAAGISRSATMLIHHLCVSRRLSYLEALNYVRDKEKIAHLDFGASPNYIFVDYLKKKFKDTYE